MRLSLFLAPPLTPRKRIVNGYVLVRIMQKGPEALKQRVLSNGGWKCVSRWVGWWVGGCLKLTHGYVLYDIVRILFFF